MLKVHTYINKESISETIGVIMKKQRYLFMGMCAAYWVFLLVMCLVGQLHPAFSLILAVLLPLTVFWSYSRRRKQLISSSLERIRKQTGEASREEYSELTDDYLKRTSIRSEHTSQIFRFTNLVGKGETKRYFVLIFNKSNLVVLDKHGIEDGTEAELRKELDKHPVQKIKKNDLV